MLFAERDGCALAFGCSTPWKKMSVGFVGYSDGWQDLSKNFQMTWDYTRAENGNIALTGEIDLARLRRGIRPRAGLWRHLVRSWTTGAIELARTLRRASHNIMWRSGKPGRRVC